MGSGKDFTLSMLANLSKGQAARARARFFGSQLGRSNVVGLHPPDFFESSRIFLTVLECRRPNWFLVQPALLWQSKQIHKARVLTLQEIHWVRGCLSRTQGRTLCVVYQLDATTQKKPGYPTNQREEEFPWLGFWWDLKKNGAEEVK